MGVGDKIRAMMNSQKVDSSQFSASNYSSNSVYINHPKSLQDGLNEISKQIDEYQKQIASSGVVTTTGITVCGHTHHTTIPGLSQQIFGGLQLPAPLTSAEEEELKELEHQQAWSTKMAKLAVFKALPREYRQSIINVLLWEEAVQEINRTSNPESDRLRELKLKQSFSPLSPFLGSGHTFHPPSMGGRPMWPPASFGMPTQTMLPEGITKDDLMQAHLDASLEEEISGGQE